jgi:hypothetical protein
MRFKKPLPRDILEVATEQLGSPPDPSIVFGTLFDAAIRSLRPLPNKHPRKVETLNRAMDRLYSELTDGQAGQGGWSEPDAVAPRAARAPGQKCTPGYR